MDLTFDFSATGQEVVTGALREMGAVAVDAVGALVGAVASTLTDAFKSAVDGALAAEQQQSSLAALIKSTGDASGLTQAKVNDLAQQFKDLAGGSDEAIVSIETIGIRSGQINADQMPQFIKNVTDLGLVMGDTTAAATLLARAQDDPEAAFKRIERSTGAYDVALQAQIKSLVKAGDTAGATALVMQFVADKTGGAAAAAADTMAGRWTILQNHLDDVAKGIVTGLLPAAESLFDGVIKPAIPVIESLGAAFGEQLSAGVKVVTDSIALFTDQTTGAVDIGGVISNILYNMGGAFADVGDAVVALTSNDPKGFFDSISAMFKDLGEQIGPMIQPIVDNVKNWITANGPGILATLQQWGQAFLNWVEPMIPPLLLKVGEMEAQLVNWVIAQVPVWIAQLRAWGQQFVAWVAPMIPPLLAEAQALANQLLAWLVAQIPPLTAQLLAWGKQFVDWVGPQIPPLLVELGKLLGGLVGWVWGTAVPAIIKAVGDWAVAFGDWVMKPGGAKDQILPKLTEFLASVGKFVISDLLPGFVGFAKSFIDSLLEGFNTNLPTLVTNVTNMGTAIINGIVSGINAAPGAVLAALSGIVNGAIAQIKHDLGISSPSTVFAGLGQNMMAGMAQGITGSAGMVNSALSQSVSTFTTSANITIDARGATDPGSVEAAGYRGAQRALVEAGYSADSMQRMGVGAS